MISKLVSLAILVGLVALVALAVAGPLYQLEVLALGAAFTVLRYAAFAGAGAAVVGVLLLIFARPQSTKLTLLVVATIAGAVTFYLPYQQYQTATSPNTPPIHDISTDLVAPPEFVAIAPLRADAPNPVEYAGPETAAQQQQAYPDIVTYTTAADVATVIDTATAIATDMGWEVVASVPSAGRLEATDTTTWFGFKDDVVVRAVSLEGGTFVDVRSKSRVGRSDVGVNAKRIRAFLTELDEQL